MKYLDFLILDAKRRLIDLKDYSVNAEQRKNSKTLYGSFLRKGDLVFDVGANMGNRISIFRELKANVVAIEPQPRCCGYLEKKYPGLILERLGAAEKVGTATLNISSSDVLSTFSSEWMEKVQQTRFKNYTWADKIEVPITTLDLLIEKHGLPKFCKIDVEGFELSVLKGLTKPVPAISFEYTVPEQTDVMADCIRQIASISSDYKYNYGIGETMELAKPMYMTSEEMLAHLYSSEFEKSSWGDIYAKLF